ncbi:IS200/IS605 family transposase [Candidatus Sumerlaeota bacterium]|nr:IS200/IS605 family transposase [Candidatus Sumerlaeota bacterium]
MPQSLAKVYVHAVFSTKERMACLTPALCAELYPYAATVLGNMDCPCIQVGGAADHVHILCALSKTLSVADFIEEIKKPTSKWLKRKGAAFGRFQWQNGYGAFSVSQSQARRVTEYIRNQPQRHKRLTFQEEFQALLRKHEIPFDERYVWD